MLNVEMITFRPDVP